ncbi:MAPEG family protein [Lichenihabitans sp. Uapishka_5]|uniref:MAPEG family protein n=1 Tax=Lichenihabitans sp. Uapishka_5 TaxID=3037302 RepID=UPI0029E80534|nr:MAPEG family protein [Lichenihabitans sp. Uapishka_5]MDX7950960.1 MAPEG family protein [Lichenihabitans sp. Uapishka_5]
MTLELTLLAWTLVLAIVQILLPSHLRTQETGVAYNTGARDGDGPPMRPVTARLKRAQQNLFETLPLFAAAVLIAHVAGRDGTLTAWGCWLYLVARIVYVPLYAAGIPYLRSLCWLVSLVGLALMLVAVLHPA